MKDTAKERCVYLLDDVLDSLRLVERKDCSDEVYDFVIAAIDNLTEVKNTTEHYLASTKAGICTVGET